MLTVFAFHSTTAIAAANPAQVVCPSSFKAIHYYRTQTWKYQDASHTPRRQTQYRERTVNSCPYINSLAIRWRGYARSAYRQYLNSSRPSSIRFTVNAGLCIACWIRVAACESSLRWNLNIGNGFYGGLQFTKQTWLSAGGGRYAKRADFATEGEQIAVASTLSLSNWPVCGSRY